VLLAHDRERTGPVAITVVAIDISIVLHNIFSALDKKFGIKPTTKQEKRIIFLALGNSRLFLL
jgi:hypothetical protein